MLEPFAIQFTLSSHPWSQKYTWLTRAGSVSALYEQVLHKDTSVEPLWDLPKKPQGKRLWDITQKQNARVLIWGEPNYPQDLCLLKHPPVVLYVQGSDVSPSLNVLSVIGTRKPSAYGTRITHRWVGSITSQGIVTVSGMAMGIDAIAHQATLKAGGKTMVVLAHGLDQCYPRAHKKLKSQILDQGGVLISEYPWGVTPRKHHFRDRNRINAALAKGIWVVEAGKQSGTRITVNEGLLLNKEIYSIPGPVDAAMSAFPNELIRDGANMVLSAQDILERYQDRTVDSSAPPGLGVMETELMMYLNQKGAAHMDEMFGCVAYPLPDIVQTLSTWEQQGWVKQNIDGSYMWIRPEQIR